MKGDLLKVITVKAESFLLLCVEHNMKSYDEVLNTHTREIIFPRSVVFRAHDFGLK